MNENCPRRLWEFVDDVEIFTVDLMHNDAQQLPNTSRERSSVDKQLALVKLAAVVLGGWAYCDH